MEDETSISSSNPIDFGITKLALSNARDNELSVPNDQSTLAKSGKATTSCNFWQKTYTKIEYLDEKIIDELIEKQTPIENLAELLSGVFSNAEKLSKSFHLQINDDNYGDCVQTYITQTQVDFQSLRSSLKKLFSMGNEILSSTIFRAIIKLSISISCILQIAKDSEKKSEDFIHCLIICFDVIQVFGNSEYFALVKLSQASQHLSVSYQAHLAVIWAAYNTDHLCSFVKSCQEVITYAVKKSKQCSQSVNDNITITFVTKILKIAFYANILAGETELSSRYLMIELEGQLGISVLDSRKPLIPFEEFINDSLSNELEQDNSVTRNYLNYICFLKDSDCDDIMFFSFLRYPFILSPTAKLAFLSVAIERIMSLNYLLFKVNRGNIIDDFFNELTIFLENPKLLFNPMSIQFIGEEAIDEGGVSREFFKIVTEKLFNPQLGLFIYQEDTKTIWFNSDYHQDLQKFQIAGLIIGLALLNHINLDLKFPMVVYRKLFDAEGTFYDLKNWNPTIYQSLKCLLDYEDDDMENSFMLTFQISSKSANSETLVHDLKPNGGNIPVGQHNKHQFVDLYSDYLLNQSIFTQFKAFKGGFEIITEHLPLRDIFRSAEELELILCGSKVYNFDELEMSTAYEDGYTPDSKIIKDFWSIVHKFSDEMKKTLLEFITGSNRVPIGGLKCLKLLIKRHGPDCDLLPTSSTCFNILFLPEYSSKEKLQDRLLLALKFSKGFGFL